jgi:hypothetical protein
MRLPSTSAALTFLMDPSREFVQFNQFAYPALQALSVVNRATDTAVIQSTGSNQPVWSSNQLQGTYSWRNNPSTTTPGTPGSPGFLFSGAQYLEFDSLASVYAAAEAPLTVVCAVSPAAAGGTIWSFADASDSYYLSLSYATGNVVLKEINSHGTFSTSFAVTHDTIHVVTAVRSGNVLTLRVDGSQAGTAAVTAGTAVPTTFVVGALNSNGSVTSLFNGSIGTTAVYSGSADILSVETFLLQDLGIIRGPTSGANSGF